MNCSKNEHILSPFAEEANAKTKLAWYKLTGFEGTTIDANGAVSLLEEQVIAGDAEAMWILGLCKEYGLGTEQDMEETDRLYKQSAEGGNEIGKLFVQGVGARGGGKMRLDCGLQNNNQFMIILFSVK